MCNKKCAYFITVLLALSLAAGLSAAATSPSPKDGATDVLRDGTILTWSPGAAAAKHDVYFGSNLKYVTQVKRAVPVYVQASIGQTATTFNPGPLELGKTYYWRVDEVDDADPNAVKVVKGDIWSFMVEVPVQQVPVVAATTSCSIYENMGPEKTIDGSGLVDGKHSASMTDMWLSCSPVGEPNDPNDPNSPVVTPEVWIQYEFERIQKLQEMHVWNWNSAAEKYFGLGVKEATILVSNDGAEWTALGDFAFAAAPGTADYAYNTVVDFQGTAAKFVRIVMKSSQRGLNEYGLSEVQFFSYPVYAREPSPAPGTTGVALDASINWRAGRAAVSHKVFLSTDKEAVANGTAPAFAVNTNSFKLSSTELLLGSTYYWRVDEVNEAETPTSFASDIWSFTVVDSLVVEDFESYKSSLASTWGMEGGTSLAVDKSIFRTGKQSMVMNYRNARPSYWAAAARAITSPRNWTKNGVKKLLIFLHGDPLGMDVPLSVEINGISFAYSGSTKNPWWTCWSVDLESAAETMGNVSSLKIRFDMPAEGSGKLYLDDIRLSCKTPSPADIVNQLMELNAAADTQGQYDTLTAALLAAGPDLLDALSSEATYTLFAPTNAAFTAAGISAETNKAILSDILRNQLVAKKVSATNKGSLKTLEGSTLVQDANVVTDDLGAQAVITASADALNGTIHTVDALLMPFNSAKIVEILQAMNDTGDYAGKFDTLLAGIDAAKSKVRDTLGKRHNTLFAPTDDAFAALGYDPDTIKTLNQSVLSDILLYHIASGRLMGKDLKATIKTVQGSELKYSKEELTDTIGGEAKIMGFDVEGSNGVIHVIDAVMMPFVKTRLLDVVALIAALNDKGDLAGQFDTLLAATEAADPNVLGTVTGAGPYTVLAPSDEAFAALNLDPNTVKTLNKVYLGDVLLYHFVAGTLSAKDALAAKEIKTIQGGVLVPDPNDPNSLVDALGGKAKLTTKDIAAANGLVHVIDAVFAPYAQPEEPVQPPAVVKLTNLVDTVTALNKAGDHAGQFDTFLAAVAGADKAVLTALAGAAENTLFLPTDDAFAALDPKIDSLDKVVVTDILLYHIAAGKLLAADVSAAASITMLKGGSLQQADGVLTDNTGKQAKITGQDLQASNGVVHVIDAVLLPAEL